MPQLGAVSGLHTLHSIECLSVSALCVPVASNMALLYTPLGSRSVESSGKMKSCAAAGLTRAMLKPNCISAVRLMAVHLTADRFLPESYQAVSG